MNWFAWMVGAGVLVLASVEGNILPTNKNCPAAPSTLTIDKVAKKSGNTFEVCCPGCPALDADEKYLLGLTINNNQKIYESVTVNTECVEYEEDLSAANGQQLTIAMQHLGADNCPIEGGLVTIDTFPELPVTFKFAKGDNPADDLETKIKQIIRVDGDMGYFTFLEIKGGYDVSSSAKEITYYFIENTPTTLTPCIDITGVSVCDVPAAGDEAKYDPAITLQSATLMYLDSEPKATFVADVTGAPTTNKYDMIFISDNAADSNLCINNDPDIITCDIKWTPGNKVADLRLVQTTDGVPSAYQKNPIKDRELLASPIGSTSIEVRWLFLADEPKLYKMILSTDSATIKEVTVDCSGVTTSPNCFGYFTGLDAATYRITIQSSIGSEYDANSQIQSKTIVVPGDKALSNELTVHLPQLEWQHISKARATICFNHSKNNAERSFSHYEFVIINSKSQWLKQKNMTQDLMGDICFAPLHINTETFDVSEGAILITTQRAVDGFTVLTEGETYIDFKRT